MLPNTFKNWVGFMYSETFYLKDISTMNVSSQRVNFGIDRSHQDTSALSRKYKVKKKILKADMEKDAIYVDKQLYEY